MRCDGSGAKGVGRLVGWVALLAGAIALFTSAGDGPLAAPPVTSPGDVGAWAEAREPATAVVAALRLVVLALAWYLLGVTVIGAAARLLRAARLVAVADVVTVPAVRRLLQGALGVGLATAAVVQTSADAIIDGTAPTPTRVQVSGESAGPTPPAVGPPAALALAETGEGAFGDPPGGPAPPATRGPEALAGIAGALGAADPGGAVGEGLATAVAAALTETGSAGASASAAAGAAAGAQAEEPGADDGTAAEWRVRAGDHLWGIAEAALADAWERAPREAEVAAYWRALMEANTDRLPDPDDPDLLHPGDVLRLPDVPGR